MFQKSFSFQGRIRRAEFGISFIIILIIVVALNVSSVAIGRSVGILLVTYIPLYWFLWAQGAKRCHDLNNSGWYQLIPFYIFWMLFADGDIGENDYGENPKGIGNANDLDKIGKHFEE